MLAYSAKKKNTNIAAECSVINPETNSDSASAKSKGALFVSAIHPIKNIMNIGNKGKINKTIFCASILTVKFKLLLNEPKKAYLELADHPANNIPYVANDDTANIYSIPKPKSPIDKPGPYGITAYPNNEKIKVIIGPKKNNIKFA